jgi:hypothetical protein
MTTPSNRYDDGHTVWVDDVSRGRVQAVHLGVLRWNSYPYSRYQTTSSDTMGLLAFTTYGDPNKYWLIAEMNPKVQCPDDLVPGEQLFIPLNVV